MWEINISVDSSRKAIIDGIMGDLAPYVRTHGGVMVRGGGCGRDYVAIACENSSKPLLYNALKDIISETIITEFKSEYLKDNAKLPIHNVINYKAFLKALVVFDREFDKELVKNKLVFNKEFMLDGFYNFRLKDLKRRWQEICDLANNNAAYLTYYDTFIELLKFLVNTINSCIDEAVVTGAEGKYKIFTPDMKELNYSKYRIEKNIDNESLVPALISLSPHRIIVHNIDAIPAPVMSILGDIFEGRLITKV